jgi:hypothetical protein
MLVFKTTKSDNYHPPTKFECPHKDCRYTNSFWSVSPAMCKICYREIPFKAREMVHNIGDERVKYHVGNN